MGITQGSNHAGLPVNHLSLAVSANVESWLVYLRFPVQGTRDECNGI